SVILVFIFLPAMFFSNGGVEGGTPIWLLLGTIYIALILEGKIKIIMILCDAIVMIICWIVGYLFPDIITAYSRGGNFFDTIASLIIVSGIIYTIISFQNSLYRKEEEQKNVQRLFSQTATALANAIDAKDKYTHGHSSRVAEYSKKIAERAGKSPAECEEIYYVALLHDVGKIGVPEAIISKEGKLTEEEFDLIKQHPVMGAQILKSITEYPYLSIGANFHHERYDGKGYPQKLKGSDIPEIARIISVADAYDAMTSKRSYRDTIPQDKVREQLIEGAGTQFDPTFANIMLHLIDLDTEYEMKEREEVKELAGKNELLIGEHREDISEGIVLNPFKTTINMKVSPDKPGHDPKPSLVLFDSLDGRYHDDEKEIRELMYYEYCEIWINGHVENKGVRKIEKTIKEEVSSLSRGEYHIEAVRIKDHALIKIFSGENISNYIIALPDSSRYLYIGLTGIHCRINEVKIEKSEEKTEADYIPRIAEEISYINVPAGDIPNIQVDGYRSESTKGIPIKDGMNISFHSISLPTARLVWHCPSYVIFTSDDGTVNGENYKEFSLVRLDGENWEAENVAENELLVNRQDFNGWDSWKNYNKNGFDCLVSFKRDSNTIVSRTENDGISIKDTTHVLVDTEEIYVALSGDQCALTNIRINYEQ
ncbi:MAG: HD-GYP domain-containing protein, partial [Lachnospiraceae bacterium]|nr:HD-GYP domain-containing protein [Lachnospiraceae bacterium]